MQREYQVNKNTSNSPGFLDNWAVTVGKVLQEPAQYFCFNLELFFSEFYLKGSSLYDSIICQVSMIDANSMKMNHSLNVRFIYKSNQWILHTILLLLNQRHCYIQTLPSLLDNCCTMACMCRHIYRGCEAIV